jgi:hypothetical protein
VNSSTSARLVLTLAAIAFAFVAGVTPAAAYVTGPAVIAAPVLRLTATLPRLADDLAPVSAVARLTRDRSPPRRSLSPSS